MDSGFRRNDGFWTFDESINIGVRPFHRMIGISEALAPFTMQNRT
jgi:hypothetical protein